MTGTPTRPSPRAAQERFVLVAAIAFLTLTFVFFGYAICAGVPSVTTAIATSTIQPGGSPFTKEQLVAGADATREYSFGSHDEQALYATIAEMNRAAGTPYADATTDELTSAPVEYTIDASELAHLDDVHALASRLFSPLLGVAVLAAFLLMVAFRMFGIRPFARALLWSGAIALGIIALLALWAIFGFDGLFAAMHGALFADGTWTFPADSLLITMLPAPFWAAMALTWAASSALVAAVSLAGGLVMLRKRDASAYARAASAKEPSPAASEGASR